MIVWIISLLSAWIDWASSFFANLSWDDKSELLSIYDENDFGKVEGRIQNGYYYTNDFMRTKIDNAIKYGLIEPKDTLMFQNTFVTFAGVSTPSLITTWLKL